MKIALLLACLSCFHFMSTAAEQEGYIIQQNGDTIRGKVNVEMRRVTIGRKELDLWAMEQEVLFAAEGGKYRKVKAEEVKGCGFLFDEIWYHFVVLDWEKNTWKKSQGIMDRKTAKLKLFLHRAFDGALPFYHDYYTTETTMIGGSGTGKGTNYVTDMYILSNDLGYVQVISPGLSSNKKFKEFLMKYLTLEEEFLKTVDEKAKFSDAGEIIKSYHEWKKRN